MDGRKEQLALIEQLRAIDDPSARVAADELQDIYHAREMAALSADVYDAARGEGDPPNGWLRASENLDLLRELIGDTTSTDEQLLARLQPSDSGFRAEIYIPDPNVLGPGFKPTLAFKGSAGEVLGTDGARRHTASEDFLGNNFPQSVGLQTNYYDQAMDLAVLLRERGLDFDITGHSLGGGLAAAASAVTGMRTVTLNAAGRPGSPGCRAFLCPQHAGMLGPPHAPEHAMDGVKEAIARAPRTGLGIARPWLVALLTCLLLPLPGCGFDLSASQPRSRYQASLERAFPDPRAQALAIAAERGDAAEIRRLMQDEGVDPDVIFGGQNGGMPLLAWPIYSGSPEGLRAMLEAGADPNARKPYPESGTGEWFHANAMVWAAEQDDPTYLELLLDHGGDPNTRNANDESLLFHAFVNRNRWRNVQLLVDRGADVNSPAGMGGTLLSHYASNGGFQMALWLMEHGAEPTLGYERGEPVHRSDSQAITGIFWHPGNPTDPSWQHKAQRWLLDQGIGRPPMPDFYRQMRKDLGFVHEEALITLPEG